MQPEDDGSCLTLPQRALILFQLGPTSPQKDWLIAADWLEEAGAEVAAAAFREGIWILDDPENLITQRGKRSKAHGKGFCEGQRSINGYGQGDGSGRGGGHGQCCGNCTKGDDCHSIHYGNGEFNGHGGGNGKGEGMGSTLEDQLNGWASGIGSGHGIDIDGICDGGGDDEYE